MYSYNEEDGIYVFRDDLEQYLLDKGVEAEHIEKMKNKILQHDKKEYYSLDYSGTGLSKRETRLVPLLKVIGTSRGTIGKSVFDNVRVIEEGKREPHRFKLCFNFLDSMTLEGLKESYERVNPVEMEYYTEDDEYYLTSDGNHRTLVAMLLGAEKIRANVTIMYCDIAKRDKYFAVKKFYNDFNIIGINETCWKTIEIVFADRNNQYVVDGFSIRRKESCYEYINKLSNEIQEDIKLVKVWKKYPRIIRIILSIFCSNKRVIQYIEKRQNSQKDRKMYIYDFD